MGCNLVWFAVFRIYIGVFLIGVCACVSFVFLVLFDCVSLVVCLLVMVDFGKLVFWALFCFDVFVGLIVAIRFCFG